MHLRQILETLTLKCQNLFAMRLDANACWFTISIYDLSNIPIKIHLLQFKVKQFDV